MVTYIDIILIVDDQTKHVKSQELEIFNLANQFLRMYIKEKMQKKKNFKL